MKFTRSLALVAAGITAFIATVPAFADDAPPAPPAPPGEKPAAPPAAPDTPKAAEPAKKERKVDPKAQEAFDRYRKQLAIPATSDIKEMKCKGEIPLTMLGGAILGVNPSWTVKDGLKFDFTLPEQLLAQIPEDKIEKAKEQLGGQFKQFVEPFFDDPSADSVNYDLAVKDEGGNVAIVMTPFNDKATVERSKVSFDAQGLVTKYVFTPKVDPNDPQAAMMAGAEIEAAVKHEKRGERHVVSQVEVTLPFGVFTMKATYMDGPKGMPLVKSVEVANPMSPEPDTLVFSSYVIDGKPVESAEKKKAEPVTPAPAPETPKDAPPAPPAPPEQK